ncbi:hypothetical protein AB3S75_034698 [Citrus x aurantiifolia]
MLQPLTSQNSTAHGSQNPSSRLVTPHTTATISADGDGSTSLLSITLNQPPCSPTSITSQQPRMHNFFNLHLQPLSISLDPATAILLASVDGASLPIQDWKGNYITLP